MITSQPIKSVSVYGVYFNDKKQVLLVKDSNSMLWGFPGGGIKAGEDHAAALQREILEETNLLVAGSAKYLVNQDSDTKQRFFYRVYALNGSLKKAGNQDDIQAANFFDISKLPVEALAPGVEAVVSSCS